MFDRFKRHDTPISRRKVAKNPQKVSEIVRSNDNFCTRIVEIPGPPNLLHSGNIPCFYSLQAFSKAKKYNFSLPSNLRSPGCIRPASKRRDYFVETDASRKGWGAYCEGVRTGGPWSRQCISSCLHKQDGGYSFPGLSETSDRSVGMVLSERYDSACSTSSRVLKCKGTPGVQSDIGFQ